MNHIDIKKYIIVFIITSAIFFTAFGISNYFSDKRLAEIKSIEDKISIDILSLETQYQLLQETTCKKISNSIFSQELNSLAEKLSYTEEQDHIDGKEVERLKRYYSLLEIKDYLLTKQVSKKCDLDPIFVLYFYSSKNECEECKKQGYVLTYLRQKYPQLRVYTFDYDLDLNAVQTLISIYDVENKLPAIVLNDKIFNGFQSVEDVEKNFPILKDLATSTVATSSKKK
jgi:hypothetical protein